MEKNEDLNFQNKNLLLKRNLQESFPSLCLHFPNIEAKASVFHTSSCPMNSWVSKKK